MGNKMITKADRIVTFMPQPHKSIVSYIKVGVTPREQYGCQARTIFHFFFKKSST